MTDWLGDIGRRQLLVAGGLGVVAGTLGGPDHPDQIFGTDPWALWSGTSFAAPQVSGAVAELCGSTPGLKPRAALAALLAGKPSLPGYGKTVRLLPGTPTG